MDFNKMYYKLIDDGYFTESELRLVTDINGTTIETIESCIYARYGFRTFKDLMEARIDEWLI